jgi:hypothetical protein
LNSAPLPEIGPLYYFPWIVDTSGLLLSIYQTNGELGRRSSLVLVQLQDKVSHFPLVSKDSQCSFSQCQAANFLLVYVPTSVQGIFLPCFTDRRLLVALMKNPGLRTCSFTPLLRIELCSSFL